MTNAEKACSVDGCDRRAICKGWCSPHYYKLRSAPVCAVEGCEGPQVGKGFCSPHYARFVRHGDPLGGGTSSGATKAWIEEHAGYEGDECLIWPFARTQNGYGVTSVGGKYHLAHRAICSRAHGEPPTPKHQAAHSCGNGHGGCVNPAHLRWATASENHLDAVAHGTHAGALNKGDNHKMARLTSEGVRTIRDRIKAGDRVGVIANDFGVASSTISLVKSGANWGHVL